MLMIIAEIFGYPESSNRIKSDIFDLIIIFSGGNCNDFTGNVRQGNGKRGA